ncbi:MAG: hypothetical protein M3209_07625 [Acidobacteriota bacterium]|nr:hypothetical protein [Acidobacteriota bacterium]
MLKARRILLLRETREKIVFRNRRSRLFCDDCGSENSFLSLDEAVSISGFRARRLLQLAEAREIHLVETGSGHLLVCAESLLKEKTK